MNGETEKKKSNFPLEKVLTISAVEYCTLAGKSLNDYEARGVFFYQGYINFDKGLIEDVNIPEGIEVIVGLRSYDSKILGTALIPKTG